ncbi:hypothetical protein TBLA_0A00820 [Henningerozyma blattae CBS 6284]|uniref:Kinesin motor domain-containing protein n=1 Tax=Henningerozyma blattae (strain ATCC 34711 / CBS 6284 / DSM 70876 / NBRC 10599 / NRRL Y-10934 / UCD 77-7) TaxID=1071380 RepID=I2GUT1_HENB6|nr:hypothetical protein TBLA_0A00820 [Tetrapisispora blattae CBS 6284]CCH57883.1 hypothetical protein TBLA_0A00820 [Tetrapisispora blattae CBS 6284]
MVQVVVRIKPEPPSEEIAFSQYSIRDKTRDNDGATGTRIIFTSETTGNTEFQVDKVFDRFTKQSDLLSSDIVKNKISELFDGFNSSIIAFGQSGTGKSFTMFGNNSLTSTNTSPIKHKNSHNNKKADANDEYVSDIDSIEGLDSDLDSNQDNLSSDMLLAQSGLVLSPNDGILQRSVKDIFSRINEVKRLKEKSQFSVSFSFYEVYEDKVFDLLSPTKDKTPLKLIRPNFKKNNSSLEIENLRQVYVESFEELNSYLIEGRSNRNMKHLTSRSNIVIKINLEQVFLEDQLMKCSSLILLDMAASDYIDKNDSLGISAKEAKKLNYPMESFTSYINLLAETGTSPYDQQINGKKSNDYNSNLVDIMSIPIGGNCKTLFISTISPLLANQNETFITLRISEQIKSIISSSNNINKNIKGLNSKKELELIRMDINLKEEYYKCQIRILEEQLKLMKSHSNIITETNTTRNSGLQEEIKYQEKENRKLKKQVKTLAYILTKTNRNNKSATNTISNDDMNQGDEIDGNNINDDDNELNKQDTNLADEDDDDDGDGNSLETEDNSEHLLNTLLEKCEQVVELQLSLDEEINKGLILQKQTEFSKFKGQTLETMNLKLLDQINLLEADLQMTLAENVSKRKEIEHLKQIANSRKSRIQYLENDIKEKDISIKSIATNNSLSVNQTNSNNNLKLQEEASNSRKYSTTSSSGNTLVHEESNEPCSPKSTSYHWPSNYISSPSHWGVTRKASSSIDSPFNTTPHNPVATAKPMKRGLDLRLMQHISAPRDSESTASTDSPSNVSPIKNTNSVN